MTAPPTHGPPEPDEGPAASFPEPPGDPAEYEPSGWEPVITRPDPMPAEERQAWLDPLDEPFDPEEYPDPDGPPPPGEDELTAAELAEIREAVEGEAREQLRRPPARAPRRRWPRSRRWAAAAARASPARRGSSPASRPARRPRSGAGWRWT